MQIKNVKINNYGKIKNKEILFSDKINVIYGENETGKSTLLHFIINSLYGISKNKKGKEYSDFERYKPWSGDDFSGKITYELDNNKKYEIFRDFKKKNPKIFNENMEDISKEFSIDKTKGNEFFYEQTKVDEDLFLSTLVVNQQEVKLHKQEQNVLIQKIANLVGTGEDNVSYKRAIDRLNRRQLDEVGTQKSREKPINVVQREIENLENEKSEIEKYVDIKYEIEEKKNELQKDINSLQNENDFLQEIKLLDENEKIEKEKIKIKENLKNENTEKINLIKNKISEIENDNKNNFEEKDFEKKKKKLEEKNNKKINSEKNIENKNKIKNIQKIKNEKNKLNKKLILIFFILIIINILQFIFIKNNIFKYIFLLTVPTFLIFWIIFIKNKNKIIKKTEKNNKIIEEKINLEINNLNNEINLIEKNNLELENEINKLKNNFNLKINLEKEKIKNKYLNKLEKNEINYFLNLENINYEKEKIQNELNNKKIELHSLELDKKNIEPKLENLSNLEEKIVDNKNKMLTLKKLNSSMELVKEVLTNSYEKMKKSVTPKFTQKLSNTISKITNGKYANIIPNDEQGLLVELDNGNYEPASKLSVGTIDQLYLSLRLSMVEELSEENMPIILDEVFAYYDDERLKNALTFLNEKCKNHQILIFSCTNREKEILEELKLKFNIINL